MKVLSKVLWAVDFNEDHTESIKKVRGTADRWGSEIVLLHVLHRDVDGSAFQGTVVNAILSELEEIAGKLQGDNDYSVKTRIEYGNVVERIMDVAEEEDVNAIFVNRGRVSEAGAGMLGLNAQKVVRLSKTPVVITSNQPPVVREHLVCPVDFSEPSTLALQSAILHARKTDARLTVITVFEPVRITSARLLNAGMNEDTENVNQFRIFQDELREYLNSFDFSGIRMQYEVLQGTPSREIIWYSHMASTLYIGSTGKTGLRRTILGSVTEKVIREAESNLVIVKSEGMFKLRIPTELEDIEKHFERGNELLKLGFLDEAIEQYSTCLEINDLHLPSIWALAGIYEKLGKHEQKNYYEDLGVVIQTKMTNRKIEEEIRRNLRSAG